MTEEKDIEEHVEAMRRDRPVEWLGFGSGDGVYRLVVWCFVVGSACHLWLADAWQLEWLFADLLYLIGIGLLAWRGAFLGWVLSALGLAIPLLFHRDQLTQSMFMLFVAVVGAVAMGRAGWREVYGEGAGDESDDGSPPEVRGFLRSVQWLAIFVYALAALHKLNADFLDPHYSCTIYGLREVTGYWNLPDVVVPTDWAVVLPLTILLAEGGIAALHLLRFRRIAWTVAVGFHIFLTFTMAPAFVFVMLIGHAAFATHGDLERLGEVLRSHRIPLALFAGVTTGFSLWLHGSLPELTMIPREVALWGLLALLVVAFPPWRAEGWRRRPAHSEKTAFERRLPGVVAVLFVLNGLTPYLGLQYQHTAAMVSNLRIDRGCWNSLVFPESMRLRDEYIRVEEVYYGEPGKVPKYERIVLEQLWSPPQVRQMRRNWCRPEIRPFYMRGTYMGREFEIQDVCAGDPLPFGEFRVFGVAVFGDFLRFQKNLMRECPQTCIH